MLITFITTSNCYNVVYIICITIVVVIYKINVTEIDDNLFTICKFGWCETDWYHGVCRKSALDALDVSGGEFSNI